LESATPATTSTITIECFIADDEINEGEAMTEEEAIEWIDYNVIGTNGGQGFIILYSNEQI
jgi:hypothetical protein